VFITGEDGKFVVNCEHESKENPFLRLQPSFRILLDDREERMEEATENFLAIICQFEAHVE
jgi:hypothetical protein